jgi:hypothetical protein
VEISRRTVGGRHVSSLSITTLQETDIHVDHVEDNSENETVQKGLIANRKKKNVDEWHSSKGQ